ncbi:unnamed protein product, partial [Ectocarpus fasciculatus]
MPRAHLLRHSVRARGELAAGVDRLVRTTLCTGSPPTAPTPAQGTLTKRAAGSTPPTSTFTRA